MDLTELTASVNPWWSNPASRAALLYPVRRDRQEVLPNQLRRLEDRRALALVGARQVGKTVILLQTVDDLLDDGWPPGNITYFDFADERVTDELLPTDVVAVTPPTFDPEHPRVLLFDEVSRAKRWDLWLKRAVDREVARIGVADSAASLLRRDTRESGQGRWDQLRVEGLSFAEALRFLGEEGEPPARTYALNPELFERYLVTGGFPEHFLRGAASDGARQEIGRRLRDDVVRNAVYRDLARFGLDVEGVKNLFVYLVEDSGAILNATRRGEDLGRDPRTVQGWLRHLEEAGLIATLPRYARKPSRRLKGSGSPRVYPADHGLIPALSAHDLSEGVLRGRVLEATVFRHLRDLEREHGARLAYFRLDDDNEIDFVLEHGGAKIGIEVTASSQVRGEKLAKLRKAGGRYGSDRLLLLHGGVRAEVVEGVAVSPVARFLLDPDRVVRGEGG